MSTSLNILSHLFVSLAHEIQIISGIVVDIQYQLRHYCVDPEKELHELELLDAVNFRNIKK